MPIGMDVIVFNQNWKYVAQLPFVTKGYDGLSLQVDPHAVSSPTQFCNEYTPSRSNPSAVGRIDCLDRLYQLS